MAVPTTGEVTVKVTWPEALVIAGLALVIEPTPVSVARTDTPDPAAQPVPSFFVTVTVKV